MIYFFYHIFRGKKIFGEICAIMAALCWAFGASLYKKAIRDMNPIKFNLIRSTSVLIYAFSIVFILGKLGSVFNLDLSTITIMGISSILVLVAGDTLYFIGLRKIGVTKTVPIAYSYSILVVLLGGIILDEAITLQLILGTITIILGVWLVANKALDQTQQSNTSLIGVISSLGTILCWGFGVVFFKIILDSNDPYILAAGRMLFLIPTLTILSIIPYGNKSNNRKISRIQLFLALLSGLISLGIGDNLLYLALDSTNTNIVAPLTSLTPIFSALIAIIFLGEKASTKTIIATLLVTTGTMLLLM
jgi:drug/metabolite transporter (DMT)-like permease